MQSLGYWKGKTRIPERTTEINLGRCLFRNRLGIEKETFPPHTIHF